MYGVLTLSLLISQKRLQIIHLLWVGFMMVAIVAGAIARVPFSTLIVGGSAAALPGLIGIWILRQGNLGSRNGEALLVICWTLLAVIAVAITGAVSSPLTILFAVAPLIALNLLADKMAVEAAIFGALAYFCVAVMGVVGFFPTPVVEFLPFTVGVVISTLAISGMLIWVLIRYHQSAQSQPVRNAGDHNNRVVVEEPTPQTIVHLPPDIPEQSGVMLLDVAEHGRITRIVGDRMELGGVYPGTTLSSLFNVPTEVSDLTDAAVEPGDVFALANGRKVRVQIEAAGEHHRILLADVSDMQAALEEAQSGEAKSLNGLRERTAFFASLGHELKTPLNAILGYADMMRAGIRGPMPDAYVDYPDIIHESGQDLLLLVDDILDLAKADADKLRLEMEPIDLAASAQSVMRQLENQADRAGIRLHLDPTEKVWANADARAVRQIWQNLVSNAIKYSDRSGTVILRAQTVDGMAEIAVEDTGEGMSERDIARILEPFTQGENSRGHAGTGLGLAVVHSFARLHGGDVSVVSREGEGTRVCVSLPLADPDDVLPMEDAAQ